MILHTFHSLFESSSVSLTPEQKSFLDFSVKGTWKINPSTGLVDVEGSVVFQGKKIQYIPVRFGVVSGNFDCQMNKLVSLEGTPRKVEGDFNCQMNKLTSLENSPQEVGGDFICKYNELPSLVGAPLEVGKKGKKFSCSYNQLTSLKGAPKKVKGNFDCAYNPFISLEGAPEEIDGFFRFQNLEGNFIKIPKGKWGFEGWLDVLKKGDEKAKLLILTILSPLYINKEIEKNPEEMMMRLKGVWNSPEFSEIRKEIVIPSKYREEMNTLGDLSDLGF